MEEQTRLAERLGWTQEFFKLRGGPLKGCMNQSMVARNQDLREGLIARVWWEVHEIK